MITFITEFVLRIVFTVGVAVMLAACDEPWDGPQMPRQPVQRVAITDMGLCRRDTEIFDQLVMRDRSREERLKESVARAIECIRQDQREFSGQVCYSAADMDMILNYAAELKGSCKEWKKR